MWASPFWTNWTFACKTETIGSLYSHALLMLDLEHFTTGFFGF